MAGAALSNDQARLALDAARALRVDGVGFMRSLVRILDGQDISDESVGEAIEKVSEAVELSQSIIG